MNINLENKTVFLTGGSRGIGASIKKVMKDSGARIIAPTHAELDLSSKDSIQKYTELNADSPDIIVHSAGINIVNEFEQLTLDEITQVFQTNYYSIVQLLQYFIPKMKEKQRGRIVLISSLYAQISKEGRTAYSSSKNALTGLTKTLALEFAPYNILINAVAPGYVMTNMTKKNLSDKEIKQIEANIPTRRFQSEEDIAYLTSFLCSDLNQSITGQYIVVDGGFTCR